MYGTVIVIGVMKSLRTAVGYLDAVKIPLEKFTVIDLIFFINIYDFFFDIECITWLLQKRWCSTALKVIDQAALFY